MTVTLHAQPYDISATGFYFEDEDTYDKEVKQVRNDFGGPVEEFEIQFIDGEDINCELAKAMGLSQGNFRQFFQWAEDWDKEEKIRFIIAVGECGYHFDETTDPDYFDIDVYFEDSLRDLAIDFVDQGLLGDIPDNLKNYLDYDAIASDLEMEYTHTVIAGQDWIYRCG